ncbi:hypothetical protein SODALDRAFT_331556 [Sodiomyces alkalinus F11]|uniref:Uncharacterized protein n=1 Tax=Sodiomyces alkalinus (strain CBS 110278 / VKM F-3762 / F11) TaxID=1314773 RepID=A0A3N2Q4U0_SODAK|nr:hypothetical protein SODALDRAFT_331556 [Sodiomyces alkalinus F11]ROT41772.1 hypothetical protein SODALDRAFT_331556 [Sodiomyces alkalinus F11]
MDRNLSVGGGRGRGDGRHGGSSGVLPPRHNRSSLPLVVNREDRKPLFGEKQNKQPIRQKLAFNTTSSDARPNTALSVSPGSGIPRPGSVSPSPSITSSNGADGPSRIPRPSSAAGGAFSKSRRPMSLADAYRLAAAEEGYVDTTARTRRLSPVPIDGSPSPAPRPRPSSRASNDHRIRRMVSTGPLELGRARHLPRPIDDDPAADDQSIHSASSSASFERRLSQFARDTNRLSISPGRVVAVAPSSIPRPGSRHQHQYTADPALQKRASMSSLNSMSSVPGTPRTEAFAKGHVPRGWVSHLLAKEEQRAVSPKPGNAAREHAANVPRPSVEGGSPLHQPAPPSARPAPDELQNPSPNKSYAWQVDQDFTARDLQVSDSPRLNMDQVTLEDFTGRRLVNPAALVQNQGTRMGSPRKSGMSIGVGRANSKLAEIRQRELDVERALEASPAQDENDPHHLVENTKLDDVQQRETEVEDRFAQLYPQGMRKNTKLDEIRQREIKVEENFAEPVPPQEVRRNTKLDEIREREKEFSSNKALAASFLDDIREHNASRSLSPDSIPHRNRQRAKESTPEPPAQSKPRQHAPGDNVTLGEQGEQIPNTPVTVYRKQKIPKDEPKGESHGGGAAVSSKPKPEEPEPHFRPTHNRADSRDLLRRLARAASTSPAPEQTQPRKDSLDKSHPDAEKTRDSSNRPARALSSDTNKISSDAQEPEQAKSSVGFLGIRRDPSVDSKKDKRSSMAMSDKSDSDPTLRIEGEMKLFAPHDNQSERGSVRAPSVGPSSDKDDLEDEADGGDEGDKEDEEDEEDEAEGEEKEPREQAADETPRPVKPDPLSLPTPKVTGAYVETPAPAKVEAPPEKKEDEEERGDQKSQEENQVISTRYKAKALATLPARGALRGAYSSETSNEEKSKDVTVVVVPEDRVPRQSEPTTTTSTLRRRARSLPRARRPLINSAKPPTVKDDLLEMRRTYQIEDSTLDDLEEIFRQKPSKLPRAPSPEIQLMLNAISTKREQVASKPSLDKVNRDSELELYDKMSKSLKDGLLGIRAAKIGIERLEDNLAHSKTLPVKVEEAGPDAKPPKSERTMGADHKHKHSNLDDHSKPRPGYTSLTCPPDVFAYYHLPIPRLYHEKPFRLSLLGLLVLLFSVWFAAETTTCSLYCRPSTCSAAEAPCYWSPDDPTWGYSLPIKLDEWVTDGHGRHVAAQLAEQASDLYLDAWDYLRGTDIRDVDTESLDFHEKRQHRRRLRKKGLLESYVPPEEYRDKWESWHEVRVGMDRADEIREAGYDESESDDVETFAADEEV